ncbi:hypothetical protein H8356DRAFT_965251 [Neocallimastix lanati (nom. inval.)]|nr:hypothetical protein H8356DRAFT_965251 [Neocallimastix sp. JGI-2020a]
MTSAPSPLPSPVQQLQIPFNIPSPSENKSPVVSNVEPIVTAPESATNTNEIPFNVPVTTDNNKESFGGWDMDTTIPFDIPTPSNTTKENKSPVISNVEPIITAPESDTNTNEIIFNVPEKIDNNKESFGGWDVNTTIPFDIPALSNTIAENKSPISSNTVPNFTAPGSNFIMPTVSVPVSEATSPAKVSTSVHEQNDNNGWGISNNWDITEISNAQESKLKATSKPVVEEQKQPEPVSLNDNIPFDTGKSNNANDGWNIDGWDMGDDFTTFNKEPVSSIFSPKQNEQSKSPRNTTKVTSTTTTSSILPITNFFDGWNNITSPKSTSKAEKKSDDGWGFSSWNNDTTVGNSNSWGFDNKLERKSSTTSTNNNNNNNSSIADSLFKNDNSSNSWFNQSKPADSNKKSLSPLSLGSNKFGIAKSTSSSYGFGQRSPPSNSSFNQFGMSNETNNNRAGSTTGSSTSNLFNPKSTNRFFSNPPPSNSSTFSFSRRRGKSDL